MQPEFTLHRFSDAAPFLTSTEPFLLQHLATDDTLLKVLRQVRDDPKESDVSAYMATVEDKSGAVVAVAFRRSASHLVLSTAPAGAIPLIASDFHSAQRRMAGFVGPAESTKRFCVSWRKVSGQESRRHEACRLYVLSTESPDPPVSGTARLATSADRAILTAWHHAMMKESGTPNPTIEFSEQTIDSWFNEKQESVWVWLWEDEGRPVSIAGCFAYEWSIENACMLRFLYTPRRFRNCGYAQANLVTLGHWAQRRELRILPQRNIRVFPYKEPFPSFRRLDRAYRRVGLRPMYDIETYVIPRWQTT